MAIAISLDIAILGLLLCKVIKIGEPAGGYSIVVFLVVVIVLLIIIIVAFIFVTLLNLASQPAANVRLLVVRARIGLIAACHLLGGGALVGIVINESIVEPWIGIFGVV